MNITGRLLSIMLAASMVLLSCSTGDDTAAGEDSGLVVKGFSLGMDLDAAKEKAVELFAGAGVDVYASDETRIELDGRYQLQMHTRSDDISVLGLSGNSDRRLMRVSFYPEALDLLFGLEGKDNDAIAQKVMADYDLPELTRDEDGRWEYREVEGISIKLLITVSNRYFTFEGFVFD